MIECCLKTYTIFPWYQSNDTFPSSSSAILLNSHFFPPIEFQTFRIEMEKYSINFWCGQSKSHLKCRKTLFFLHKKNLLIVKSCKWKKMWKSCKKNKKDWSKEEKKLAMPLSICSDSEDDQENRPQSAKTSIDLSWPNNIVNLEDVSHILFTVETR